MRLFSHPATRTAVAASKSTTTTSIFLYSPRRRTMTSATQTLSQPPSSLKMSSSSPPPPPAASFTTREATPADADAMCEVFFDAFRDDEIARRVFPAGSRRARAEMRRSFAQDLADPHCHKFVAEDAASPGRVVAVATWSPPGAAWERYPSSSASNEKDDDDGGDDGDEKGDAELGHEFFAMMDRKHGEHMAGRPHWTLGFLAVRRAWQGRGVAGPLVAWGLDRADRDGVDAYVQSSPRAVPVYRRFGFEQIDAYAFRRADYVEVFLRRTPRPPRDDAAAEVAVAQ